MVTRFSNFLTLTYIHHAYIYHVYYIINILYSIKVVTTLTTDPQKQRMQTISAEISVVTTAKK